MKLLNSKLILILIVLILCGGFLIARSVDGGGASKKFDLIKYHNVGNIWLRVSNYGFFGSGDDIQPQWPSLEYPGGSAIDYLYQGALWFGAKKIRRNAFGEKLYWIEDQPTDRDDCIPSSHPDWTDDMQLVVDTLTTVGFDGDADLYEFLPAYNPLETSTLGTLYSQYNVVDTIMTASIRKHRRGVDDDGDGLIDEDPVGYAFPLRTLENGIPEVFGNLGGNFIANATEEDLAAIDSYSDIWYPLGFVDLSYNGNDNFNFCEVNDDDNDGLFDEDGYPISEQDFISFYYDYSPFGTSGERDWGGSSSSNNHGDAEKLNIRVRQMSYQWSYDYIKNLVYVEFNITNMNPVDTLFDCAMGIYMDSDVGPQAYDGDTRSLDDISSYVPGEGFEFAYTYDADGDNGLTTGLVGSRVCTPDPEQLEFACWYWNRGDGPDDGDPLNVSPSGVTANQKYWLLTNKNPASGTYISLRDDPGSQLDAPDDTRYLFAFYGDMQGLNDPTDGSWNLSPGKTMKIVIAIFPGESLTELKTQAVWAKDIYENPQNLVEVILPDTLPHYQAPEPPTIPNMYAEMDAAGNSITVYWDNRSQMENIDTKTVPNEDIGWQDIYPNLDSYVGKYDDQLALYGYFPEEFAPYDSTGAPIVTNWNPNGIINPWTGYRLRHDFQGYAVWSRSGSGSQEYWVLQDRWDKEDTNQDLTDYETNIGEDQYKYFGGSGSMWYKDKGLPEENVADAEDTNYYRYDDLYDLVPYEIGDKIYGSPIYDYSKSFADIPSDIYSWSFSDQSLWFKHPDMRDDVYLAIYDDRLIPLEEHLGENNVVNGVEDPEAVKDRLARRYYSASINNPPKGIEYYISVTAWDRGIPSVDLLSLESGRDGNMKIFFPGPSAADDMDDIYVVPNPYVGQSDFDGRRSNDEKGDRSRRIWFVNVPEDCKIKIFTLAGDLVDTIDHNGAYSEDIITISKAASSGIAPSGMATWDLLSRHEQIIAPGVYLFSVKDNDSGDIKVGKFVIIK
ncbi:MAG: hypothetical protein K9N09_00835 [Candidatus Cloacimonetes bacterium]|nr:hypothetical protein [Candidatus Cloacimonadota bacterium]MCF7813039.1 hypothetical protein [Candidatus Cloacimonadota bacterium]MCF7867220.1 hypothetical protein [Candidatus Cloacimonadota bacterium]MCF7882664.1 hypothetical protein [Candidatus Cloacimonadota bacterium]